MPVTDAKGHPDTLPISVFNKLGYGIAFDDQGRDQNWTIDFETMARHLLAPKHAADYAGIGIRVVIFDNKVQRQLLATPTGNTLAGQVTLSTRKPWVGHDEHYHVDFIVPCDEGRVRYIGPRICRYGAGVMMERRARFRR